MKARTPSPPRRTRRENGKPVRAHPGFGLERRIPIYPGAGGGNAVPLSTRSKLPTPASWHDHRRKRLL